MELKDYEKVAEHYYKFKHNIEVSYYNEKKLCGGIYCNLYKWQDTDEWLFEGECITPFVNRNQFHKNIRFENIEKAIEFTDEYIKMAVDFINKESEKEIEKINSLTNKINKKYNELIEIKSESKQLKLL